MPRTLILILLLARIGSGSSGFAAELTLPEAIRQAAESSPRLQKAQAAAEESDWKRVEALSGFLPSLSVNANHLMAVKYQLVDIVFGGAPVTIPQILPGTTLALNASLPVFDGFQNVKRYSAAGHFSSAARKEADWAAFQLEEDVRLSFNQAIAAQRLALVSAQNVKTLEDHLNQIKVQRGAGVVTNFDVLRVEVQINEARSEQMAAEDNVLLARRRLSDLLGAENDSRPLTGELPVPAAAAVKELTLADVERRADYQAIVERTTGAESMSGAASTWWVPRLSLGAQYQFYNNRTGSITDTDQYRSAYQVGAFVTWNLFDGMTSIARSKEALYESIQAEKSAEQARIRIPTDFEFWKRRYLYSTALYNARVTDIAKSQESVRLALQSYRAGARTNTEVLDAELELFRARAGVVTAQMNAFEALVNLELALGRKI